jgi:hypothetical protein
MYAVTTAYPVDISCSGQTGNRTQLLKRCLGGRRTQWFTVTVYETGKSQALYLTFLVYSVLTCLVPKLLCLRYGFIDLTIITNIYFDCVSLQLQITNIDSSAFQPVLHTGVNGSFLAVGYTSIEIQTLFLRCYSPSLSKFSCPAWVRTAVANYFGPVSQRIVEKGVLPSNCRSALRGIIRSFPFPFSLSLFILTVSLSFSYFSLSLSPYCYNAMMVKWQTIFLHHTACQYCITSIH